MGRLLEALGGIQIILPEGVCCRTNLWPLHCVQAEIVSLQSYCLKLS